MKNYGTTGNLARSKKPKGDSIGKVAAPFPKGKVVMPIYGGSAPHVSHHKLKLTDRVINFVSVSVPEYLHWSKSLITFNQMDHVYSIPKPGWFPLIIDPLVGRTWLTKALMDGAAASTSCTLTPLRDWDSPRTISKIAHTHSMEMSSVGSPSPLGGLPYRSPSETQATTTLKCSCLK
jgi:hypothetical protein